MDGQLAYKKLLNNFISPALRKRDFIGSGGNYQRTNPYAYVQIGFQKNKWNTRQTVGFTINISVISKRVWKEATERKVVTDKKPSALAVYPIDMWFRRIGQLARFKRDTWWKVDSTSDLEKIAADILKRIDNRALPAIRKQLGKIQDS